MSHSSTGYNIPYPPFFSISKSNPSTTASPKGREFPSNVNLSLFEPNVVQRKSAKLMADVWDSIIWLLVESPPSERKTFFPAAWQIGISSASWGQPVRNPDEALPMPKVSPSHWLPKLLPGNPRRPWSGKTLTKPRLMISSDVSWQKWLSRGWLDPWPWGSQHDLYTNYRLGAGDVYIIDSNIGLCLCVKGSNDWS